MDTIDIYKKILDETFSFYKENNHITYSKNINMVLRIYGETIKKTSSVKNSKLLISMENILEEFFVLIYNTGDVREVLSLGTKFIDMLIESMHGKEEKIFFPLIFYRIFESIKFEKNYEIIENTGKLLMKIKGSKVIREEEILKYNFIFFQSLVLNEKINAKELTQQKKRFLNNVVFDINYGKTESFISIEIKSLYYILKDSIKNLRDDDINLLLDEVFVAEKLSNNGLFQKISTVFHFYVYYLTVRESDVDSKTKEELKEMFNTKIFIGEKPFKEVIKDRYVEELWSLYPELYNELVNNGWEVMPPNQVKTLKIHYYINEYFIFFSLYLSLNKAEYFEAYIFEELEWEKMFQLISFFNRYGFLKEEYFNSFGEFLKLIDESNEFVVEQLEMHYFDNFGEEFIKIFKGRLIKNAAKKRATFDVSSEFNKEKEQIIQHFEEWTFKDLNNDFDQENTFSNIKINDKVTSMTLPIDFFERNTIMYGMSLAEGIVGNLELKVLQNLKEYVEEVKLSYKENNKITKILDIINKDIKIDSIIMSERVNQRLKYTESLSDLTKMEEILSSLKNYGSLTNAPINFYFDSSQLSITNTYIDIQIRDLTSEELNEELSKVYVDEKTYKVDVGYGLEVSLENKEVKDYYNNKYYKLDVVLKCDIVIGSPKVGYFVYIT